MLSVFLSKRFRHSKEHKGITALLMKASTLGVMLGVTVLIIALSVINGFEEQLETRLLSVVPHVSYDAPHHAISDWPVKADILQSHPNILAVSAEINLTAMVQFKGQIKAAQLKGVVPQKHKMVSDINRFIANYNVSDLDSKSVILGKKIAQSLGANIGDKITLLVANKNAKKPLSAPKRVTVYLKAVIAMGGPVDESLALVNIGLLQTILDLKPGEVTSLRAKVDNVFDAHNIAMNAGRLLNDLVYVNSWFRTQGSLYQDIQMVRTIVFLVVFLIIAVASFNIVSSMVMEVKEKQSNIAILKTMGAKDRTIFATFALQGIGYAVMGSLFGTVIGVLIATHIPELFTFIFSRSNPLEGVYFVEFLPSKLVISDIVITLSVTFLLATLASVFPAWQATKIDPARTLGN